MKRILTREGLVAYQQNPPFTVRLNRNETNAFLHKSIDYDLLDDHCEIVHLEISAKCNFSCAYCYNPKDEKELLMDEWHLIIDQLANYGIFQVTFGGGEPFLRKDIFNLAFHAKEKGLNCAVTTNGSLLKNDKRLKVFDQINVSWHGNYDIVSSTLSVLQKLDIPRGINYVFSKNYENDLDTIVNLAKMNDAEILFLTYKPVKGDYENMIEPKFVLDIAKKLHSEGVKVAVDGLSCFGLYDDFCLQKKRFCDIGSNGDVFPCSFVREPIGNVLSEDFRTIWKKRGQQIKCPFVKNEVK